MAAKEVNRCGSPSRPAMTALMAGLGLLPAALSSGIGSETQRPFACVIVGGIVSGTFFTLLVLPLAIRLFGDFEEGPAEPRQRGGVRGCCDRGRARDSASARCARHDGSAQGP